MSIEGIIFSFLITVAVCVGIVIWILEEMFKKWDEFKKDTK